MSVRECIEYYASYYDIDPEDFVEYYGVGCANAVAAYYSCLGQRGTCELYEYDGEYYYEFTTSRCDHLYDEVYTECDFG